MYVHFHANQVEGGDEMVVIEQVTEHSRAARAGLRAGDVLAAINGNSVSDVLMHSKKKE